MTKIIQLGDTHIFNNIEKHHVHEEVFNKIYEELDKIRPDYIVHGGDLLNSYNISNEASTLAGEFLLNLSKYCKKLYITSGNHEFNLKNFNRLDSLRTVVKLLNIPNIVYMDKSGFYEEDDVIFVNYYHIDKFKKIDPWDNTGIKIPTNVDTKPTVALFHDPIYNCETFLSKTQFNNTKYKPITYFSKNTLLLASDIHEFQYLRDDKTAAYCGSTIQCNFGESPSNHGMVEWCVKSKTDITTVFHNIPNDYNYINFDLRIGTDYDNIILESPHLNEHSNIKVKWNDISANMNFENEIKIRSYFKDVCNIQSIKIVKNGIYTDVSDVDMVSESIDVLNPESQKQIFIEYLKANGHGDVFINDILRIDDVISDRLNLNDNNIGVSWNINKLWFNNFKSYGDNIVVDFDDMGNNSLIQITGMNANGKTTILDAICYTLYGKTLSTTKREKNGDNRYINNKRQLDNCMGGATISINDKIYTIIRETTRKWNRSKTEISSCSTNVEYYLGTELTEDNKLNGEQKKNTQSIIDDAIGDFNDFIRLVLTTADNLNDLISMDRSIFIDSIIKDAGYDIFEKKLNEFKLYRKERNTDKINIDIDNHNNKIFTNYDEISKNNILIKKIEETISNIELDKMMFNKDKDNILSKIETVDESLELFSVTDSNDKISKFEDKINMRNNQLDNINDLKKEIENYDTDALPNMRKSIGDHKETMSGNLLDSKNNDIKRSNKVNELNMVNVELKNITDGYIRTLEGVTINNNAIVTDGKNEFNKMITDIRSDYKEVVSDMKLKQQENKNDINILTNHNNTLESDNKKLETSKICTQCERELEECDMIHISNIIDKNILQIKSNNEKIDALKSYSKTYTERYDEYMSKLEQINNKDYSFEKSLEDKFNSVKQLIIDTKEKNTLIFDEINNIKVGIVNDKLAEELKPINDKKNTIELDIKLIDEYSISVKDIINTQTITLNKLVEQLGNLEEDEKVYKKKLETIQLEDRVNLDIEKLKTNINKLEDEITNYNKELGKIESNKKLKLEIDELSTNISLLETSISVSTKEKVEIEKSNSLLEYDIKQLKAEISKFEKQKKMDELLDSYMKCVHRDGLPTYLLKKSIHIINQELNNILLDVNFTLFFDNDLNLKLSSNNRIDISQNAIESSGMERTFSAVALKMALRKVNNKSKPNFIMFDEIMTKLVNDSVDKFIMMIDNIKDNVDKLIIIEHIHPINYDVLVEVTKDQYDVSSLNIIY